MYINDLAADLKCNVKLFADNASIFSIVYNPNECAADLNNNLNLNRCWAHDWRMSFNPDLAKHAVEVTFSKKKIPADHPPLLFKLYKLYVRLHLDYGDVIYHIPQKVGGFKHEIILHRQMEWLGSVQYSAELAITGAHGKLLQETKYTRTSGGNH